MKKKKMLEERVTKGTKRGKKEKKKAEECYTI